MSGMAGGVGEVSALLFCAPWELEIMASMSSRCWGVSGEFPLAF